MSVKVLHKCDALNCDSKFSRDDIPDPKFIPPGWTTFINDKGFRKHLCDKHRPEMSPDPVQPAPNP